MTNIVPMPRPPWPPQCDCGQDPCQCGCQPPWVQRPPQWSQQLQQCWNDIAMFRGIVRELVDEYMATLAGSGAGTAVTANPPSNPKVGMLWFNGTLMQIWNGTAWVPTAVSDTSSGGGGASGVIISVTTPGNPFAGMQWWNGSILQVYDGTNWNQVGPSAAAGPVPTTTRVFSVTQAAAIGALTANTWTIVPFNATPTIDTEQGWNAATRQYKPTKAGIYQFLCRWPTGDVALPKNDTGTFTGNEMWVAITTTTGATGWQGITGLTVMNGTTDFVRMYAYATTAYAFPGNSGMPLFEAWLMA